MHKGFLFYELFPCAFYLLAHCLQNIRIVKCALTLTYEGTWIGNLEFGIHFNQDSWNVDSMRAVFLDLEWDWIIPNPNPD